MEELTKMREKAIRTWNKGRQCEDREKKYGEFKIQVADWTLLAFNSPISHQEKLFSAGKKSGLNDAVAFGILQIHEIKARIAVIDFRFIGGRMRSVVSEKIARETEFHEVKTISRDSFDFWTSADVWGIVSSMRMANIWLVPTRFTKTLCRSFLLKEI